MTAMKTPTPTAAATTKTSAARKRRPSTVQDLAAYLSELEQTSSSPGESALLSSYGNELRHADRQEKSWREKYYGIRLTVLLASAAITDISGITVPTGGVLALRITLLVLGALITVLTGSSDLYHTLNRWRIYRVLRYRLLTGGLAAATSPTPQQVIPILAGALAVAQREFEDNYITQIATEGSPPKEPTPDPVRAGQAQPAQPAPQ